MGFGYYKLRIKVKVRYQTIHEYCSNNWIHQYRTYVAEKGEFKRLKGYHGKVEEGPEDDELASITASGLCKLCAVASGDRIVSEIPGIDYTEGCKF